MAALGGGGLGMKRAMPDATPWYCSCTACKAACRHASITGEAGYRNTSSLSHKPTGCLGLKKQVMSMPQVLR